MEKYILQFHSSSQNCDKFLERYWCYYARCHLFRAIEALPSIFAALYQPKTPLHHTPTSLPPSDTILSLSSLHCNFPIPLPSFFSTLQVKQANVRYKRNPITSIDTVHEKILFSLLHHPRHLSSVEYELAIPHSKLGFPALNPTPATSLQNFRWLMTFKIWTWSFRVIFNVSVLLHRCSQSNDSRSLRKSQKAWPKGSIVLRKLLTNPSCYQRQVTQAYCHACVKKSLLYQQYRNLQLTDNMGLTTIQKNANANTDAVCFPDIFWLLLKARSHVIKMSHSFSPLRFLSSLMFVASVVRLIRL